MNETEYIESRQPDYRKPADTSAEEIRTPRTDAAEYVWKSTAIHRERKMVDPSFAKQLERELAILAKERDMELEDRRMFIYEGMEYNGHECLQTIINGSDQLKQLRAALADRDREITLLKRQIEDLVIGKALTSQPDTKLCDDVREFLDDSKSYANTFTLRERATQLLTRLGSSK